ncbi:hypothetical protein [Micromonospora sp. NPDC049301]|uniref:hypothetical protein n=1 Tax=Micromonospora sp. NPDC049301 TaxID=3155723 RepID=UPI003441BF16
MRMFDGELRVRDHPAGGRDRITAIHMLENGVWVRRDTVAAGQIAALRGLAGVRVGDTLGDGARRSTITSRRRCWKPSPSPTARATAGGCARR